MENVHYETSYQYELRHWWHRVRREMVHDILSSYFGNRTDLRLADIGCGTGALTKELERYGNCIGIDISPQAIAFCRSRGVRDLQLGNAEATGCEADTFDAVVCLDVLEHLRDDTKGIAEIGRILKLGGIAIIFVPAFKCLWGVTDETSHHYRRYRLTEIEKKFLAERFTILRKSYFNTMLFPLIALIRIPVRLLRIPMRSETVAGNAFINEILYRIFRLERRLLQSISFPIGVSVLLVVKKISSN